MSAKHTYSRKGFRSKRELLYLRYTICICMCDATSRHVTQQRDSVASRRDERVPRSLASLEGECIISARDPPRSPTLPRPKGRLGVLRGSLVLRAAFAGQHNNLLEGFVLAIREAEDQHFSYQPSTCRAKRSRMALPSRLRFGSGVSLSTGCTDLT